MADEDLLTLQGHGKRLKGLDELEKPEFVGRTARFGRRKKLVWWGLVLTGVTVGAAIGSIVVQLARYYRNPVIL